MIKLSKKQEHTSSIKKKQGISTSKNISRYISSTLLKLNWALDLVSSGSVELLDRNQHPC